MPLFLSPWSKFLCFPSILLPLLGKQGWLRAEIWVRRRWGKTGHFAFSVTLFLRLCPKGT